jgi:hypothetical protein
MARTKPGEVCDCRGVPIHPGDLVRTDHFRERNGRRHYLYHVAVWNAAEQTMELVPVSELEPKLRDRGGRCWLMEATIRGSNARVIHGHGPGDCLDYTDRPRRKDADDEKEPTHDLGGEGG